MINDSNYTVPVNIGAYDTTVSPPTSELESIAQQINATAPHLVNDEELFKAIINQRNSAALREYIDGDRLVSYMVENMVMAHDAEGLDFLLSNGADIGMVRSFGRFYNSDRRFLEVVNVVLKHGGAKFFEHAFNILLVDQEVDEISLLIRGGIGRHIDLTAPIGSWYASDRTRLEVIAQTVDTRTLGQAIRDSNWSLKKLKESPHRYIARLIPACLSADDTGLANALSAHSVAFPLTMAQDGCRTTVMLANGQKKTFNNIDPEQLCRRVVQFHTGVLDAACGQLITYVNDGHACLEVKQNPNHSMIRGFYPVKATVNPKSLPITPWGPNIPGPSSFYQFLDHTRLGSKCEVGEESMTARSSYQSFYPKVTFYIAPAQAIRAIDTIEETARFCESGERVYRFVGDNCVDFVQSVFTDTGAHGHFYDYFSQGLYNPKSDLKIHQYARFRSRGEAHIEGHDLTFHHSVSMITSVMMQVMAVMMVINVLRKGWREEPSVKSPSVGYLGYLQTLINPRGILAACMPRINNPLTTLPQAGRAIIHAGRLERLARVATPLATGGLAFALYSQDKLSPATPYLYGAGRVILTATRQAGSPLISRKLDLMIQIMMTTITVRAIQGHRFEMVHYPIAGIMGVAFWAADGIIEAVGRTLGYLLSPHSIDYATAWSEAGHDAMTELGSNH